MSEIETILEEVEENLRRVAVQDAEDRLTRLISDMGRPELRVWDTELRRTIEQFLPKRRRRLLALLQQKSSEADPPRHRSSATNDLVLIQIEASSERFAETLAQLSTNHIFQWATYYRDAFREYLDASLPFVEGPQAAAWSATTLKTIAEHSFEIFDKGRRYTEANGLAEVTQNAKSIGGLARVTDLCLEWYSANVNASTSAATARGVRRATSTMLVGLATGFAHVPMGYVAGRQLLSDSMIWVPWLPFLTHGDLERLRSELVGPMCTIIDSVGVPLALALDRLVSEAVDFTPLPILAEYKRVTGVLTVSLQAPLTSPDRQRLDLVLVLRDQGWNPRQLRSHLDGVDALIVMPTPPDTRAELVRDEALSASVIPILDSPAGIAETTDGLVRNVQSRLYRTLNQRSSSVALTYNFAREFPLHNPSLTKYYYVVRTSVRDMLSTFERRNGVRLWCSVRRSGKTTAGFDLGDATGDSVYVSQTCDSTGQSPNDSILYQRITQAIARGDQLDSAFLRTCLDECADGTTLADQRAILVLDEYETLFGQLRTSVQSDERLRYTVAQPLLNQFVEFARDNLVVFLGQQPNAHAILMEQNQLTPYVEQVAFPLFRQGSGPRSEFMELISRVFGDRASFDASFARRLHSETAGHPFLTVNMLVDFVDWLIARKRPLSDLQLSDEDISTFGQARFRRDRISVSPEYTFFRDSVIPQALSALGREKNPWLFAMYSIVRQIALENPSQIHVSRSDFSELMRARGLDQLGFSPEYLLTSGSQSNFLTVSDTSVAPAIRLLGRIAAVAHPAVVP